MSTKTGLLTGHPVIAAVEAAVSLLLTKARRTRAKLISPGLFTGLKERGCQTGITGLKPGARLPMSSPRGRRQAAYQFASRSGDALILWIERSAPSNSSSWLKRRPMVALSTP